MTTDEKVKAYDEALERAKKLKETCDNTTVVGWCEYIFPELVESEDEKIRYFLINFVKINDGVNISPDDAKKALAWLGKQGEKKPAWSEKDDAMLSRMIEGIECLQGHTTNDALTAAYRDKIDWLKSLKDRLKGK